MTKNKKTMVLASLGNTLAFPQVSALMRRLLGPCGYASRQDVLVAQDMDTVSEEEDCDTWAAYRKAKRAEEGAGGQENSEEATGGGRAENATNRRTGERNRCYTCNGEYRHAPQSRRKENRYGAASPPLRPSKKSPSKPYSSVVMETPVDVGSPPESAPVGPARAQERSFSTTTDLGGQFAVANSESVVVLGAGSTANSVCNKWLENHN